jgi:hypothetical protein
MVDAQLNKLIHPILIPLAQTLIKFKIKANTYNVNWFFIWTLLCLFYNKIYVFNCHAISFFE